jgi:hypothetical protein
MANDEVVKGPCSRWETSFCSSPGFKILLIELKNWRYTGGRVCAS